jgi:hypothetical protein
MATGKRKQITKVKNGELDVNEELLTKEGQKEFAKALVGRVESGNASAAEVMVKLKAIESAAKEAQSLIEYQAIEEADTYENNQGQYKGVSFKHKSGSRRYSYSHDEEYNRLKAAADERAKLMKQRAQSSDVELVTKEEGEVIPPAKVTYTKDSLEIKFPDK